MIKMSRMSSTLSGKSWPKYGSIEPFSEVTEKLTFSLENTGENVRKGDTSPRSVAVLLKKIK
jgi:hypothetical protein